MNKPNSTQGLTLSVRNAHPTPTVSTKKSQSRVSLGFGQLRFRTGPLSLSKSSASALQRAFAGPEPALSPRQFDSAPDQMSPFAAIRPPPRWTSRALLAPVEVIRPLPGSLSTFEPECRALVTAAKHGKVGNFRSARPVQSFHWPVPPGFAVVVSQHVCGRMGTSVLPVVSAAPSSCALGGIRVFVS